MNITEIKPCPFCGGGITIGICDSEGNPRDTDYANDPYSGLSYVLYHRIEKANEAKRLCVIATNDDEPLGCWQYDTKNEATASWNERF